MDFSTSSLSSKLLENIQHDDGCRKHFENDENEDEYDNHYENVKHTSNYGSRDYFTF